MEFEANLIYCGDNLKVLAEFPEKSIDLIYADPPFFSNKAYEIIWGNGAEMKVYEDRWRGGINVYIEWMKERLWQCHRVLKDTGSMYLHCDWHANAHLRIAMDGIFGEKNFRDEIIWSYSKVGGTTKKLLKWHETIFRYTKTGKFTFNIDELRVPYSPNLLKAAKQDEKGSYYTRGLGKDSHIKRVKKTYFHPKGRLLGDVWDLGTYSLPKGERLGYPTQKPEALLRRIIEASSDEGDVVLDPFCGCGTTLAVSQRLGRRWIGVDVSPIACNLVRDRLNMVGASDVRIIGAPKTVEELKALEPFQFQNWVMSRISGVPSSKKSGDMGIDGHTFMVSEPVQVKQSEGVGRNVVDNFETAIRREHETVGYIIAFSFAKSAYEEAARAKLEHGLDIKLVRVDEIDQHF